MEITLPFNLELLNKRLMFVQYVLDNDLFDIDVDEEECLCTVYMRDTKDILVVFDLDVIDKRIIMDDNFQKYVDTHK